MNREVFVRKSRRRSRVNLLPVRFVFTAYVVPCSRFGERQWSLARPETKMTGQPRWNRVAKTLSFRRKGGRTNDNSISYISYIDRWGALGITALFGTAELWLFGIVFEIAGLMVLSSFVQ